MLDMATKKQGAADVIREAVSECGKNRLQVAKAAGVGYASVFDFVNGRDLYLSTVAKILDGAGLKVVVVRK